MGLVVGGILVFRVFQSFCIFVFYLFFYACGEETPAARGFLRVCGDRGGQALHIFVLVVTGEKEMG